MWKVVWNVITLKNFREINSFVITLVKTLIWRKNGHFSVKTEIAILFLATFPHCVTLKNFREINSSLVKIVNLKGKCLFFRKLCNCVVLSWDLITVWWFHKFTVIKNFRENEFQNFSKTCLFSKCHLRMLQSIYNNVLRVWNEA